MTMKKELNILEVFPEIDWIKDHNIRQATINVWNRLWDECSWEDILTVPCTPKLDFPHVIHNRSVLLNCVAMADTYEKLFNVTVNRDHLISACLLQDASKLVEYEKTENGVEKSLLGKTFPHAFYAAHVAMDENLPYEVVQAILEHTPDSAEFPKTLIAKILFYADQADMAALQGDRWKKTCFTYR